MQKVLVVKPEGERALGRPTLERRQDLLQILYTLGGRELLSFGSGFGPATDTCEGRI